MTRYVKASADKLKFFQAQFDSACTMRDCYKSELERSQVELKQNLSKVGDESEAIARAHEQVRLSVLRVSKLSIFRRRLRCCCWYSIAP